ncbi:MAG: DUF4097 family beta strand repeat-containing protein [Candidatus Acidiferrales bacterium]
MTNGNGGRQRNSIFGGLLLILLGLLFLFERFHPGFEIGHLFRVYWPLLLILWGVAKLIDYLLARQRGDGRPPILSGGEAALLVLVVFVLIGMSLWQWGRRAIPNLGTNFDFLNQRASQSRELPPKAIAPGARVTVTTNRGDIAIHVGQGSDLRVLANESASGPNDSAAQERLRNVNVMIEPTSDGYNIHPSGEDYSNGHVSVRLDIELPKQTSVSANSNHGDISISGLAGGVRAESLNGDVEIHDCGGDVSATGHQGDVRVTGITGNVTIGGSGGDLELGDISGNASIGGQFSGDVRVRNVAKLTRIALPNAQLALTNMTGRLELDSDHIEISDVGGAAKIATSSKDVDAENVAGALDIQDVHGTVKASDSQAPTQNISISNVSGEVDLTLPRNSSFQISATSTSGEVRSDFEAPSLQLDNGSNVGRLVGRIGTGGPSISIATTYGTIHLHQSS